MLFLCFLTTKARRTRRGEAVWTGGTGFTGRGRCAGLPPGPAFPGRCALVFGFVVLLKLLSVLDGAPVRAPIVIWLRAGRAVGGPGILSGAGRGLDKRVRLGGAGVRGF